MGLYDKVKLAEDIRKENEDDIKNNIGPIKYKEKTLREKVGEFSSSIQQSGANLPQNIKKVQKTLNPFENKTITGGVGRFGTAFGENWGAGGKRIIQGYSDLNKAYTEAQNTPKTSLKEVGSTFKDLSLRTWNTGANTVMSSIDMVLGSPIAGTFGALAGEDGVDEDSGIGEALKKLDTGMQWAGKHYTGGLNTLLKKDLTESEKEVTKFVGGEGLAEGVGFGVIKGGGAIFKVAGKVGSNVSKKIGDVIFTKDELAEAYQKRLDETETSMFQNLNDPIQDTEKLYELMKKIGNGEISVKDVNKMAKDIGLDPEIFSKKLNEVTNRKFYQSKATAKIAENFKSKVSPTIRKSIDELGYEGAIVKHGKKQVDSTLNQIKNEGYKLTPEAQVIQTLFEQGQLKGLAGKEFLDDDLNAVKGINLKRALDMELMERIEGGGKKEGLDSFRWTEKGLDVIKKEIDMKPFQETYKNGNLLANHIADGASDYPTVKFKKIASDADNNKTLPSSQVKQMFEELIGRDYSLEKLDGIEFYHKAGDEIDLNKTFDLFVNVNQKYNLKLDKDIENIITGGRKALDDLFKKFNELKKDNFVTIDSIKNPGKTINLESRVGFTDKIFTTLDKGITKLSEGDLNKRLQSIRNEINKARIALKKKYKGDAISLKIREKALDLQYKAQLLDFKAKYKGIADVKDEIRKSLNDLKKDKYFKGDAVKVIEKFLNKKNWGAITDGKQLEKKLTQLSKDIEAEHARGLIKEIKEELKGFEGTKDGRKKKTGTITAEQVIQLETANKVFGRIRMGDLDVGDLEDLLKEINEIKEKGKASKRVIDKKYSLRINNDLNEIKESLEDKYLGGSKNVLTKDGAEKGLKDKMIDAGKSWNHKTLFGERLIEKIFGKDSKAYDYFYKNVIENYNAFDAFEKVYTDGLAKNIGKIFGNDVKKLKEYGTYLYARRRLYDESGKAIWIGIDRIKYDKSSVYKNKTNKYLNEPKPDEFYELPNEIWDEIKQTELAGIMIRGTSDEFKNATKMWDSFHRITGKMLKDTALRNGNQIVDIDDYYISFQARKGPSKEIEADIGSAEFYNTHLSTSTVKKVNKQMMNGEYVWDYNPISILYGNGRKGRYYSFMKDTHRDMVSIMNGNAKPIKELTIDEYNDVIDNQSSYTVTIGDEKVEIIGSKVINGEDFIEYKLPDVETTQLASPDAIRVKGNGIGLNDKLSDEASYRLKDYVTRIGNGGSMVKSQFEKNIAIVSNHFNRLPLMGSISVIAKQPLALIDGGGLIGYRNLYRAEADLWNVPDIDLYLDKVPSIFNRGGGDFLIKELKNFTTGAEWADKAVKKYNGYVELAMAPIKMADTFAYKRLWLGAYRDYLVKNGMMESGARIDIKHLKNIADPKYRDAIAYADTLANKTASTANPLLMPQIYDNVFAKAMFGIFTTQLNRIQLLTNDIPNLWKEGDKRRAVVLGASLMTSNIMEAYITYQVGQIMYGLGVSTWEGYGEDMSDMMFSYDTLYRITLGQFFLPSKIEGLTNENFGPAPIFGGLTKNINTVKDNYQLLLDGDLSISSVADIPVDLFGGKILEQIKAFVDNNILE